MASQRQKKRNSQFKKRKFDQKANQKSYDNYRTDSSRPKESPQQVYYRT
jgi:hypothetical protein